MSEAFALASNEIRETQHPIEVPMVVVLDYDRTLVDVEDSFKLTLARASKVGIDPNTIKEGRTDTEASNQSFSPLAFVRNRWGETAERRLVTELYSGGIDHDQFYSDVEPFLDRLQIGGIPSFVMTYAEHFSGQYGKVVSSPYDGGIMITPDSDKGVYEETFRFEDGYHMAVAGDPSKWIVAEEACLVDDKPSSFRSWEGSGFCILRGKELKDALPPNVRAIQSLDELTVFEGRIVHVDDVNKIHKNMAQKALLTNTQVLPTLNVNNKDSNKVWVSEAL